jgi:hypothetical protein
MELNQASDRLKAEFEIMPDHICRPCSPHTSGKSSGRNTFASFGKNVGTHLALELVFGGSSVAWSRPAWLSCETWFDRNLVSLSVRDFEPLPALIQLLDLPLGEGHYLPMRTNFMVATG